MLVLLLNRPDMAGDITRNETYNLQNLYGGAEPVLETRYIDEEMGWAGDWIGRVWQWMSANDIFIQGGTPLDLACQGDCALTDIVTGTQNRGIRVGTMRYDLNMLSQLILPDGVTFARKFRLRGNGIQSETQRMNGKEKIGRHVLGKNWALEVSTRNFTQIMR